MRSPISGTVRARRRAGAAEFRRVMLRIIGAGLVLDALFRLVFGRSLASYPPLQHAFFLITGRRPRPHPPRWQETLLGIGEGAAAFRVLNAAPLSPGEIARTLPEVYRRATEWIDHTLLARANDVLVQEVGAALPESGRLLVIGDPTRLLSIMVQRGVRFGAAVAVDESDSVLGLARQRLGHLPNVTFLQRNLELEPLPGVDYDVVAGNWTIGTPSDPIGLITRAWQALRPNGAIVLLLPTDPGAWWSMLLRPIVSFLGVRLIERELIEQIPDLRRIEHFAGGLATLVVLRKEVPGQGGGLGESPSLPSSEVE